MVKQALLTFFLSFTAMFLLGFLYVFLPQYLVTIYAPEMTNPLLSFITGTNSSSPLPSVEPRPSPGLTPVTLIIPKLKIQTAVEPVGLTQTNNMDVPKNAGNVGWYMFGTKPSDKGNSVISGHYDTPSGKPAIFYFLDKLEKDDEITIVSENAVRSTFVVIEKSSIPYDKFPSDEIFVAKIGRNLNLITCGGVWDSKKKTYTNRIVIYTTLKESGERV